MHIGVDWNGAPKTAQWWAVDANGQAHWFMAPNIAPFTDFWFTDLAPAPLFHSGNWLRLRLRAMIVCISRLSSVKSKMAKFSRRRANTSSR